MDKKTKPMEKKTKPMDKKMKPMDKKTKPMDKKTKPMDKKTKEKKKKKKENGEKDLTQRTLLEYLPTRRSSRKCKTILESEQQELIAQKLRDQVEEGLKVMDVEGKGRGVVSTKIFKSGELLCEYSGERISVEEAKKRETKYNKDASIGCYMYYFKHKGSKFCIDSTEDNARMGRLLNHCKTHPNVKTKVIVVDDSPYLCLVAARDILVGEELEYDYGERDKATIATHPWLAS